MIKNIETNHRPRPRPEQQQQQASRPPLPPAPVPVPDVPQRFVPQTPQIVQQPRQPQILPPRPNSRPAIPAAQAFAPALDFDALIQARISNYP